MSGFATDITIAAFLLLLPYLFVMLRIYKGLTLATPFVGTSQSLTTVSVIVATRNRPAQMEKLLEDLRKQEYPNELLGIIIADDSNGLWDNYKSPSEDASSPVRVIRNDGKGKKDALRCAVEAANSEVIVTTDDDCRVGCRWVLTIVSFMRQREADMILCPVMLKGTKSLFDRFQQLEFAALQGTTAGSAMLGDPVMCNGAGLAFRRELYPGTLSALNPKLLSGDDTFLMHHLKKKGNTIVWLESEDAIIETEPSQNLSQFCRQRSRWASKSLHYTDSPTILTGTAVLAASAVTGTMMIMTLFDKTYLLPTFAILLFKSVPDMLIITNRIRFFKKEKLINLFPVVQILYPFYVLFSFFAGLFRKSKW